MVRPDERPSPEVLLSAMVLMTLADGRVAEEEVTRIRWIHGQASGEAVSEADVGAAIAAVRARGMSIDEHLAELGAGTTDAGRRLLLKVAFAIASADGHVVDEEDALLARLARSLGIPPELYRTELRHLIVTREFL